VGCPAVETWQIEEFNNGHSDSIPIDLFNGKDLTGWSVYFRDPKYHPLSVFFVGPEGYLGCTGVHDAICGLKELSGFLTDAPVEVSPGRKTVQCWQWSPPGLSVTTPG